MSPLVKKAMTRRGMERRIVLAREHLMRRLVAVFAADAAGYSRLTGADEEGTHVRLREHLQGLFAPILLPIVGPLSRILVTGCWPSSTA